jgi:hypothetical protein
LLLSAASVDGTTAEYWRVPRFLLFSVDTWRHGRGGRRGDGTRWGRAAVTVATGPGGDERGGRRGDGTW